jgi:hypothetical protein
MRLRETLARAVQLGFTEANVARWFEVPLVSDVRYVRAPPESSRPRRGLSAIIALLVAGEAIEAAVLERVGVDPGALVDGGVVDRMGTLLRARMTILPVAGLLLGSARLDDASIDAVGAPDLSALNLLACLPARVAGLTALDVGCGAGIVALGLARAGAHVVGSDVDARAVEQARWNAAINGLAADFAVADLFGDAGDRRWDLVTFNAPLSRAPLAASDPFAPPRYLSSPRGEDR